MAALWSVPRAVIVGQLAWRLVMLRLTRLMVPGGPSPSVELGSARVLRRLSGRRPGKARTGSGRKATALCGLVWAAASVRPCLTGRQVWHGAGAEAAVT